MDFLLKETNSSLTKNLDKANTKKEELEEKIRLLTLALEEKQVEQLIQTDIEVDKFLISSLRLQRFFFFYNIDSFFLTFQRTISDLEGKVYNANYNQKYLQENVQDLQAKLDEER